MIESLTPEQEARFPEFVQKWTKIGLCTDPADRPAAENAIHQIYKEVGLTPPKIIWCLSPIGIYKSKSVLENKELMDSTWNQRWYNISHSVRTSIRASVRDDVWAKIESSVTIKVEASVGIKVWNSIRANVHADVGDSIMNETIYSQYDAGPLSFYDYFREALGLKEETEKYIGYFQLAQFAGWVCALPYENTCFVSERPCLLKLDAQGRLHNLSGPALQYPDGWSIYAINGAHVPEWIDTSPK